jgi:hypothetical protein
MYVSVYVCAYVCIFVYSIVWVFFEDNRGIHMYVCILFWGVETHVGIHVCMVVYMYVCMCVCVYV